MAPREFKRTGERMAKYNVEDDVMSEFRRAVVARHGRLGGHLRREVRKALTAHAMTLMEDVREDRWDRFDLGLEFVHEVATDDEVHVYARVWLGEEPTSVLAAVPEGDALRAVYIHSTETAEDDADDSKRIDPELCARLSARIREIVTGRSR